MSRSGTVRILRGNGGRNMAAAPYSPTVPDLGAGGFSLAERLEEARAAGYEAGYKDATAEYRSGAEATRTDQMEKLAHLIAQAAQDAAGTRSDLLAEAEAEAVELAFELAESIVQRELAVSESLSTEAVRRAIGLVPRGEDLIVRLHPDDVIDTSDISAMVPESSVKVVADPSVEEGGCVVTAGPCQIDAQIRSALERARALIVAAGNDPATDPTEDSGAVETSPLEVSAEVATTVESAEATTVEGTEATK